MTKCLRNDEAPVEVELVPARMVNEFIYCPRLAYLEWVQGEFAINADVAEGRFLHRNVDRDQGAMPKAQAPDEVIHARSVWLSAPEERLTARMDLVESDHDRVTPVDYKRGAIPDNPERAWLADRVQLCAQGLILEANGYACTEGVLYYCASRRRVNVPFDESLVGATRAAVQGALTMAASGSIPPPLQGSPKCIRCSLAPICLPDEVSALSHGAPSHPTPVRRLVPTRHDALPLYVQEQGARVGRSGELFEVKDRKTRLADVRILDTSQVCLFGNVQVTTQALQEMCQRGIPLTLFSCGGWFYGIAHGMNHKNVELRIAQFRTAADPSESSKIAAAMIATKILNCRTLLKRNHATRARSKAKQLSRLANAALRAESTAELLGLEGTAARLYFSDFAGMFKGRGATSLDFDFEGRNRRPPKPTFPVNPGDFLA